MQIRRLAADEPFACEGALDVLRTGLEEQAQYATDPNYTEDTIRRLTRNHGIGLADWWIAITYDDQVLGFMAMQIGYGDRPPLGPFALLQEIDVAPPSRGQSVGRLLVQRAEDEARKAGMAALVSSTHTANEQSICFHIRCGFVRAPDDVQPRNESGLLAFSKRLT